MERQYLLRMSTMSTNAWPGRIDPVLAPPRGVTRGLDHRKSDVSDLRPSKGPELGNTRVLVVHLLRIKSSCEKDGLHQSRMFPTLAILNAPKSGTPDFGVKPGNDGGNRSTSVLYPFHWL